MLGVRLGPWDKKTHLGSLFPGLIYKTGKIKKTKGSVKGKGICSAFLFTAFIVFFVQY